MSQFQENLKVQYSGFVLAIQDGIFKFRQWFTGLPKWERTAFITLLFLLIPGLISVRYGSELFFTKSYNRAAIAAHPAFNISESLKVGSAKIVKNSNNSITAYVEVTNPNLDLALESLDYTFHFLNSAKEEVTTSSGKTYLLPDQKKWIVVSKVQSSEEITQATIEIPKELDWQKRLDLPGVDLKMSEPYVYEEVNPLATVAEGSVVNSSPFDLNQVSLLLVLYGKNNRVLAVTTREEYNVKAFERRAYKLQWPGIYNADIVKVDLQAYTNTLEPENISASSKGR